ncbi:MAG: cell division protein FtsQ/DivIB [Hyphomonadaceae bacterium]
MAAVRRRRARRGEAEHYQPEPPKRRGTPRLAAIQLDGASLRQGPKFTRRGFGWAGGLTAAALIVAVTGATLIGGPVFNAGDAAAIAADRLVAAAGLRATKIDVIGADGARAEEVRAMAMPPGRESLLSVDPAALKARVESLDWVADAQVRRLWPGTLRVEVQRRAAFARWQEDGEVSVIDAAGERLFAERAAENGDLPLVVGRGAGPNAAPLLAALEDLPQVRSRTRALVRVGDRRWNLKLDSGATVALPENGSVAALTTLETLQTEHDLLDRPIDRVDMRVPGRVAVRVFPALAGARHPMLEGA